MKGISAVIATILMLMITVAMVGVAYMYISGMLTGSISHSINLASATCNAGASSYVTVRNLDPNEDLFTTDLTVFLDGAIATVGWSTNPIPAKGTTMGTITNPLGPGIGTTTIIKVAGPSNSGELTVYCR